MTNSEATLHSGHALKQTERSQRPSPGLTDPLSDSRPQGHYPGLLLDDLVAEGPGAAPLSDAGQTEGVTAGGQDTEPAV